MRKFGGDKSQGRENPREKSEGQVAWVTVSFCLYVLLLPWRGGGG